MMTMDKNKLLITNNPVYITVHTIFLNEGSFRLNFYMADPVECDI